jgi:hypothetical protein
LRFQPGAIRSVPRHPIGDVTTSETELRVAIEPGASRVTHLKRVVG